LFKCGTLFVFEPPLRA